MNERAGLGTGGGSSAGGTAIPGTVAGDLSRRAGDFVSPMRRQRGAGLGGGAAMLIELARQLGQADDALIRQDLARLYSIGEIGRMNALRLKAAKEAGGDIPGLPNVAKLSMSQTVALSRDLGLRLLGPAGTLHAYEDQDRSALDAIPVERLAAAVTEAALLSPAPSIYGGTDQIQRNIIGERVLGLPREPGYDRDTPFSQLPKNV
jgi:alkylation response protein AidB-like acyl-CoA dehydrogenase